MYYSFYGPISNKFWYENIFFQTRPENISPKPSLSLQKMYYLILNSIHVR